MTTVFNPSGDEAKAAFPTMKPRPAAQRLSTNLTQSETIFPTTKSNYVVGNFNVTNYVNRVVELSIVRYKTSPQYESQKSGNYDGQKEAFPSRSKSKDGGLEAFPTRSGSTDAFPSRPPKPEAPTQSFPSIQQKQEQAAEPFPSRSSRLEKFDVPPPKSSSVDSIPREEENAPEVFPSRSQNTEAFPSRAKKQEQPTEAFPTRSKNTEAFPSRSQNTEAFPSRSQKQEQPTEAFPSKSQNTEAFPTRAAKKEEPATEAFPSRSQNTEAFPTRTQNTESFPTRAANNQPSTESFPSQPQNTEAFPSRTQNSPSFPAWTQTKIEPMQEGFRLRSYSTREPRHHRAAKEEAQYEAILKIASGRASKEESMFEASPPTDGKSQLHTFTQETTASIQRKNSKTFPSLQPLGSDPNQTNTQGPEPFPTKTEAFPSRNQKKEAKPDTLDFAFVKTYVNGIISRCLTKANASKNEQLFAFPKRGTKKEQEPAQQQTQQQQQTPSKSTQELANEYAKKAIETGLEKYKKTKADDTFSFPSRTNKPSSGSDSQTSGEQLTPFPARAQKTEAFPSRSQTNNNNNQTTSEQNKTEAFPSRSQKTEAFPSRSQPKQEQQTEAFPSKSNTTSEAFPSRSQQSNEQLSAFPSRSNNNNTEQLSAFPSRSQQKPNPVNTQPQEEEKSAFPSRSSPRKQQPQQMIQEDEDDDHGLRQFPTHQLRHHSPGARPPKMSEDLPPSINVMLPAVDQDDVPQSAIPARPQSTGEDSSPSKRPIFNPILSRKPPVMPSRSERNSSAAREAPPMADKLKRSASTGSQNILLRKDLRAHFEKTDSSELKQAMERKDIE